VGGPPVGPASARRATFADLLIVFFYILAVLVALFIVSGVVPRYRVWVARLARVEEFYRQYRAWVEADSSIPDYETIRSVTLPDDLTVAADTAASLASELRPWLVARRNEMQRDAESVGKGVMHIAPPPMMISGGYVRHAFFLDLFDDQTNSIGSTRVRVDDLATIIHEVRRIRDLRRRSLFNPWAWVRLSFERVIAFPRYVLLHAGFRKAADSTAARVVTVVWSFVVGVSTIGAFVVGIVALGRHA
jgi:hypothetical protein